MFSNSLSQGCNSSVGRTESYAWGVVQKSAGCKRCSRTRHNRQYKGNSFPIVFIPMKANYFSQKGKGFGSKDIKNLHLESSKQTQNPCLSYFLPLFSKSYLGGFQPAKKFGLCILVGNILCKADCLSADGSFVRFHKLS